MNISLVLFFIFVHISLLFPGYAFIKKIKFLNKQPGLMLIFAYIATLVIFSLLSAARYVLNVNLLLLQIIGWIWLVGGLFLFIKEKLYRDIIKLRFPLICLCLMTMLSGAFIGLSFNDAYKYNPDPEPLSGRNYEVLNVKVLNVSHTNANDNYIPYRQAQFFVNRSNPGKDCFICEWGVGFFQRTPLMGAVTAGYFIILGDKPPVDYLWSSTADDVNHTYAKFQILAQVLNALFIIPAYYLISVLFKKRVAIVTSLILVSSSFFLYNSIFSWPKSLVAFFILTMWLLLIKNKLQYTIFAGIVGGLAFVTHDLAILYIASTAIYLIFHKRWRDTLIFGGISALIALPWLILSSLIYKKPSTFILYPFSLHGLPQPGQDKQIIKEFLSTSPIEIISIRFDTLFYLITPHDLIYSKGEQSWWVRLWATSLFSIPGSIGLGLIIPTIIGVFKKIVKIDFWILTMLPLIFSAAIIGWRGSRTIASLHFAQAIIVLLSGLGVAYLIKKGARAWIITVLALNCIQLLFVILYSYGFKITEWISNPLDIIYLLIICFVVLFSNISAYKAASRRLPKWFLAS